MKKIGVLFAILLFSLLIINFNFIFVRAQADDLQNNLEENVQKLEDVKGKITEIKETRWDYIGKEFQKILLKNKIIISIDEFLKKGNIIFVIFFREEYSLSLTLFLIILLWFYLLFEISKILSYSSPFSSLTSKIIALGLTVIIAQLGFLRKIIEFFGWFIFSKEASLWRFFTIFIIMIILIFLARLNSAVGKTMRQLKQEKEKGIEKTNREILNTIVKAFLEGFS